MCFLIYLQNSRKNCIFILKFFKFLIFFFYFRDLFSNDDKSLIVIGIIGKSNLPNCNKMSCFDLFSSYISLTEDESNRREVSTYLKFNRRLMLPIYFFLFFRVVSNSTMKKVARCFTFILKQLLMSLSHTI